jgi:hypothetical protein
MSISLENRWILLYNVEWLIPNEKKKDLSLFIGEFYAIKVDKEPISGGGIGKHIISTVGNQYSG